MITQAVSQRVTAYRLVVGHIRDVLRSGISRPGVKAVADAEQVEGLALQRGGGGDEPEGGQGGVGGLDLVEADGGQVGEQAGEAVHGQVAVGALGRGFGQGPRGAGGRGDGAGAGGLGGWLVVVGEQQRREAVVHVPGDVVRQHPQEHVRADPGLGAVADRADVQVGIEGAERPLDLGEGLVGGDHLAAVQAAGFDGGAQHVDAVEGGFGGDGVLVAGVAEAGRR